MTTPDGIYLVHFSKDNILLDMDEDHPTIIHKLVRAHQFMWVEDWANENCPDNYVVAAIEKQYVYRDLYENQEPDAVITKVR